MLSDAQLARARAQLERRMTETVEVGNFKDDVAADGSPVRVLTTERYAGRGRIKYESLTVSDSDRASQLVTAQRPVLSIPTGSPLLHKGDEVNVTASGADVLLIGRTFTISGTPQVGQTSAHRYPLKELS